MRETKLYKSLDPYSACMYAESEETPPEEQIMVVWQYISDNRLQNSLQGYYGRTVARLLNEGLIEKPL